jgi:hypothetical protein
MRFVTDTSQGFTFSGGNVGIGTTNPLYALDVIVSGTGPIARFNNGSDNTGCTLSVGGILTCTSDARLKKNIADSDYGLDEIMKLRPVDFNWKSQSAGSQKTIGFIAQDVAGVLPQLVITDANGYQELNTIGMVPVIVKGMQEQQSQITAISNSQFLISNQIQNSNDQILKLSDANISTGDKINIIGQALNDLQNQNGNLKMENDNAKLKMNELQKTIAILEDQMKLLTETNQAVIDFAKVFDPKTMVMKDSLGNLDLGEGQLEAGGIVAGAFTVKMVDSEKKTIGTADLHIYRDENADGTDDNYPGNDGKSIEVKTKAVSDSAKIFVTPQGNAGSSVWVEKIFDANSQMFTGFKIHSAEAVTNDIKIDWFIVESR